MTTPVKPGTSKPTTNIGGPALNPQQQIELQLKALDASIKSMRAKNDAMKRVLAKLGNSPADRRRKAMINVQWKLNNTNLGKANEDRAKKQNTLWEMTGDYEKLLAGTERDAFMAINALFKQYDLGGLAGKIFEFVKNGYSADTISILLQDSKEYKERFAGNEARKAAGLPVLSAGEYLATEAGYRQIMESAGLPRGFYDQHSDFNQWIAKNVSPSEIQSRVDLATQATVLSNANYRKALNQMGISDSDLTSYFLDPDKALPYIQKAAATAAIGAQALAQGLSFDQRYAEQLATGGITADQAKEGYAAIGSELDTMKQLGGMYGEQWTQRESEEAMFEGTSAAVGKKKRLASQERGAFSGQAGAARGGLAGKGGAR